MKLEYGLEEVIVLGTKIECELAQSDCVITVRDSSIA